jgi:hypothetical protein
MGARSSLSLGSRRGSTWTPESEIPRRAAIRTAALRWPARTFTSGSKMLLREMPMRYIPSTTIWNSGICGVLEAEAEVASALGDWSFVAGRRPAWPMQQRLLIKAHASSGACMVDTVLTNRDRGAALVHSSVTGTGGAPTFAAAPALGAWLAAGQHAGARHPVQRRRCARTRRHRDSAVPGAARELIGAEPSAAVARWTQP